MPQNLKATALPFRMDESGYPKPAFNNTVLRDMIRTILLTKPGERVMRPTYGSYAHILLFGNIDQAIASRVAFEIRRAIAAWEPRVNVIDIELTLDSKAAQVIAHISWRADDSRPQQTTVTVGEVANGN